MIIYFLDRGMGVLGLASTELPEGFSIQDDRLKEETETATRTLSFALLYSNGMDASAKDMSQPGNYLVYQSGSRSHFFTVIDSDIDADEMCIDVYAEDGELDLLNDSFPAMDDGTARSLPTWLTYFSGSAGFTIGTCEVGPSVTKALTFTSPGTALERLQDVAEAFGVELDFSFSIKSFSLAGKYISAYIRKGSDTGSMLRDGIELSGLRIGRTAEKLITAVRPEGNDGVNISESVYDDGDIYTISGSDVLYCRSAITRYGRVISGSQTRKAIAGSFEYDTSSAGVLLSETIKHLKKYSAPIIEYECDLIGDVALSAGDTVRIASERLGIYETVRVLSLETSECSNERRAVLGSL